MSDELETYAKDLAIAWWRFAKKRDLECIEINKFEESNNE
jgi:hypothetical protein